MVNKVRVNIAGTPYAIATTDSEKYILGLAKKLDEDITKLLDTNDNLSVTKAAVFCAMDYLDEYKKSTGSAENMRSQIQSYIADAAHAKLAEDKAKAENETLRRENAALRGTRMEEACSSRINTGMFAAMKEAGDVMGVFVGHDHDNDYAVMWKNILLAYGRYTGGNTVYNHLPNGARIIVLDEGARTFTSWIRQKDGIVDKVSYPASFVKDDWTKR